MLTAPKQCSGRTSTGTQLETLFTKKLPFTGPFALDLTKGKVYWIKEFGGSIYRANLDDGSHVENLVPRSNDGTSLALDLAGGKMYYTIDDGIYRANLDGSQVEALVTGLDDPGGLVLVLE